MFVKREYLLRDMVSKRLLSSHLDVEEMFSFVMVSGKGGGMVVVWFVKAVLLVLRWKSRSEVRARKLH